MTYLQNTRFACYTAGIYMGKLRFAEDHILFAKVDERRRTQMQENRLDPQVGFAR